jgi:hypothetical protein
MLPNPNLTPVPDKDSLVRLVKEEWERITRAVYDDIPYSPIIRSIEGGIAYRKTLIDKGALNPNFDWQYDLDRSVFDHQFNLNWIDHHKDVRTAYFDYWKAHTERTFSFLREVALNGMKSILLIHGGVAVGALAVC